MYESDSLTDEKLGHIYVAHRSGQGIRATTREIYSRHLASSWSSIMSIPVPEFKSVMRQFATGITVLTVQAENRLYGLTVNTLTSVSLDPPLILVCIDRHTPMHTTLPLAGVFAVNILGAGQAYILNIAL